MRHVKEYGAYGDGKHTDTRAIQNAINDSADRRERLIIANGTYSIDRRLDIPSNAIIQWENGAWIVMEKEAYPDAMLHLDHVSDVTLDNPLLDGNGPNPGRQFIAIAGLSANRVRINGGLIQNVPGVDGYGILLNTSDTSPRSPSKYWWIRDTRIAHCEGNGISICSAQFISIDSAMITECTHSGIDIEPDESYQLVLGIMVRNCILNQNGTGIIAITRGKANAYVTGHISISGNSIENNADNGVFIHAFAPATLCGNVIRNNGGHAIYLNDSLPVTITGNLLSSPVETVRVENTVVHCAANGGWQL